CSCRDIAARPTTIPGPRADLGAAPGGCGSMQDEAQPPRRPRRRSH
ncbi:MAG: hypothetical protein AVDCRST_MAG48-2384, partial [uncultured Friedmanniella sp.]